MKKYLFLVIIIITASIRCQTTVSNSKTIGCVNYKMGRLSYTLINNSKPLCIISQYCCISTYLDTITFEAYPVSSSIYYDFTAIEFKCVNPRTEVNGFIENMSFDSLASKYKYFIKVYDKSFEDYIKENKIPQSTYLEDAFNKFEVEHGTLVQLEYKSY
jgi:hypothetical protein